MFVVALASLAAAAATPPPPGGRVFLDNGSVRLGVDMESGGCVFHFSESKPARNVLNHHDRGRFVQQSYYGRADGSKWGDKPWQWNPVQGGDYQGKPARVVESRQTDTTLYAKTIPRHWATGEEIASARMEEWIELRGDVAHIRYKFTHSGGEEHPRHDQEMPAVFADYALPNLVCYDGDAPWRGAELTRKVPGWPNERQRITENWAAYIDDGGWGLGVYTPGTGEITCYRYEGTAGPDGSGCSYFAPVRTFAIGKQFAVEYDVYLTIGKVADIRGRFAKIHKERGEGHGP